MNTVLTDLNWKVGGIISGKWESAEWGDGVVNQLASFIARTQPGQRGFSRPHLFRMKQFYEAYRDEPKVSALTRQIFGFRTSGSGILSEMASGCVIAR